MRIGLFSDAYLPDINGVVSSVATLKLALEKLGHTVFVISNHKGVTPSYDQENHILRLPGLEVKKFYGYKMSSPIQIMGEDYIRKMDLDLIHVHTEMGIGLFARQMAKKYAIPLVYTYHTLYEDYLHYVNPKEFQSVDEAGRHVVRFLSKMAGNSPMAVIAPSNKTKKTLQRYGVKTPIYIVPTGIDLSDYLIENLDQEKIKEVRHSVGLKEDDHVVVFVGRIAKEKAIEIPIEAMSLVQDSKMHLVVVGGGTDLKFYQKEAERLQVQDRVHFLGKIPKEEIPYYYSAFDCFVSASLSETQGMTYLEALASGLMVFGRRDEVLEGLVEEGQTGFYFDDAKELALKLDAFFSQSKEDRQKGRQQCVAKTESYNTELFAQKVLAVYQQAIDDYQNAYYVEKIIFLKDDFVLLHVRRKKDSDVLKIKIPDDDFFELKISKDTILDAGAVQNYINMQDSYQAYIKVKRRVVLNDYTALEVKNYCKKRLDLDEELIQIILRDLTEKNLIDDRQYAFEKVLVWQQYGMNKVQIRNKLKKAGILESDIEDALTQISDADEEGNAYAQAKRLVKGLKAQSQRAMRQNLIHKLVRKGYSMDIATKVGQSIEINTDEENALKEAIKKAKRLYASKSDREQFQKIRLYCMKRGFKSAEIDEALEGDLND